MRLIRRLLRTVVWSVLAAMLLSVLIVLVLRLVNPPTSAFMIAARLESWSSKDRKPLVLRQQWRDLREISPQAAIAVVASEDQLFPQHRGFDVAQIRKALDEADQGGRARGASTISQQTAKNLFLWSGRSLVRKGLEAWFTVLLEAFWPKRRILEVYLNIAQFGSGVYGVQAAAREYFRHDAARLSASEAALLAAVLPNPVRLKAAAPSAYVQRRRDEILAQMQALGGPGYLHDIL